MINAVTAETLWTGGDLRKKRPVFVDYIFDRKNRIVQQITSENTADSHIQGMDSNCFRSNGYFRNGRDESDQQGADKTFLPVHNQGNLLGHQRQLDTYDSND